MPGPNVARLKSFFTPWRRPKRKPAKTLAEALTASRHFVEKKTEQIRKQYGCQAVEFTVEMQDGDVKLKAKAKI